MSRTRQPARAVDEAHLLVRSLGIRYPADHRTGMHAHEWAQLVYATEGVVTVDTAGGRWVVPDSRAVWVPAGTRHGLETAGRVLLQTLYLRGDLTAGLPAHGFVMAVSPLLRELIVRIVEGRHLDDRDPRDVRIAQVTVDQIDPRAEEPLAIALPTDPRARRIAERLRTEIGCAATLEELADGCGASPRTVERVFRKETGMSLSRWRRRVRVLHALRLLASGSSVTAVALDLGYEGPSAFIAMFRRELGTTPGEYFRQQPR